MGNKLLYYIIGSYIYCYGESFYRVSLNLKNSNVKTPFHSSDFTSNAYVLSFVLLSPIVLPFHALNFVCETYVKYKN
jgi:hypothetical protein